MSSVDPPTVPGSRRSRAPTITIDTSTGTGIDTSAETATDQKIIERRVETRELLSASSSFDSRESRPTSPHNVSSPMSKGFHGGFLAVPGLRSRDRQNSIENGEIFKHEAYPTATETAFDEDALRPDPGSEKDFEVNDDSFAFSQGQLNKLINPKSLSAFYALGGLSGLEKGLRYPRRTGLDIGDAGLKGSASFGGPIRDLNVMDKPPSKTCNKQSKSLQECSFIFQNKVPGVEKTFKKQPKSMWEFMWHVDNDKVLIGLAIVATVCLAFGLYASATSCSLTSNKLEWAEWAEGASIILVISLVIGVGTLSDHMKEKAFTRLHFKEHYSTQAGAVLIVDGIHVERKPQPNLDRNRHSDLRGTGHFTAHAPVIVRMVTGSNTETTRAIAAECDVWRLGGVVMDGRTIRKMNKPPMNQETSRLEVLELPSRENRRILARKLQRFKEADSVTGDDFLKEIETRFFLGFIDAVLGTVWTSAMQLLWINLIMDTIAALALAMNSLFATDSKTKLKSYELVDFAKRKCDPGSTRHKVLQQPKTPAMSQRVFVAMGGLVLLPLVAATSTELSSSNWGLPVSSSTAVDTTRKVAATATSMPRSQEGRDTQPGKWREIPRGEEWMKSLAPLHNILWATAISVFAFVLFRWFCESRSRRIDKARKYCFFWMVVFQALFFLVRDDPDSPPGFLFGLSIGSGFFTYKSAARGAARFDFGLFYALTGIVIGVVLSFITLPFIRTESGKPNWETILFPSIAVAFSALEIVSQCFLANMNYRDEDEANDKAENGNELPLYRDPHSRSILSVQNSRLEGSHQWQASQFSRAGSTRESSVPQGVEHVGTYPRNQGISQSVDLPHPDSYLPANDDSRSVGR
ncbi:hypothetical protein DL98DRAFT_658358 [Cadophora sp. DSE1049]|nr:hypothetical protein DL98DRAFT_658358 [Cadophora sp. DSE1049]